MSFLVRYLVGDTRGRDHQYWPRSTFDEMLRRFYLDYPGSDTSPEQHQTNLQSLDQIFPAIVNLEVLMHMAWRVREWTVSAGSWTYSATNSFAGAYSLKMDWPEFKVTTKRVKSPPDEDNPLRDVTDERDILGPPTDRLFDLPSENHTLRNAGVSGRVNGVITPTNFGVTPGLGNISGNIRVDLLGNYVIDGEDIDSFFPAITVSGVINLVGGTGGADFGDWNFHCLPIVPHYSSPPVGGLAPQGTLTIINPDGGANIVIPVGVFGRRYLATVDTDVVAPVDVTMTPTKWWQYENSRREPIFSTSTGQPIGDLPYPQCCFV